MLVVYKFVMIVIRVLADIGSLKFCNILDLILNVYVLVYR